MEDATVQRFATGVVAGRADAGPTAVGQRVPEAGGVGESQSQVPCGGWDTGQLPSPPLGLQGAAHRSKKEARRRRSRTLCRVPALTWQFMSCALVMYTLVPEEGSQRMAGAPKPPHSPRSQALVRAQDPPWPLAPGWPCCCSGKGSDSSATTHGAPTMCHARPCSHVVSISRTTTWVPKRTSRRGSLCTRHLDSKD